jgi:hypothetical protein
MDISLLRIETPPAAAKDREIRLQWSGANNSLWSVTASANQQDAPEFLEIKADKQPIGKYSESKPFTSHPISLPERTAQGGSMTFYLFSDGYADQFSPEDKKLMKRKFKDIILSIQHLTMNEQKDHLELFHKEWKASMEQTDDVLVIGIKLPT